MTENVTITKEEYLFLLGRSDLLTDLKNDPNVVILTKETYSEMEKQIRLLEHLQNSGVDNWEWYSTPTDEEDMY